MKTTVADRSASRRRWAMSSAPVMGSSPDVGSSRKKRRIGEQLDGDAGPLALPAAQGADPDADLTGQAHGVDRAREPRRRPQSASPTTGGGAGRRSGACVEGAGRHG